MGRYSVVGTATRYGWMDGGSNQSGGEIFRIRPDWPWDPPRLLCNAYRVSLKGVKLPGRSVENTSIPRAEVKESVKLYLAFVACSVVNFTFTFISVLYVSVSWGR